MSSLCDEFSHDGGGVGVILNDAISLELYSLLDDDLVNDLLEVGNSVGDDCNLAGELGVGGGREANLTGDGEVRSTDTELFAEDAASGGVDEALNRTSVGVSFNFEECTSRADDGDTGDAVAERLAGAESPAARLRTPAATVLRAPRAETPKVRRETPAALQSSPYFACFSLAATVNISSGFLPEKPAVNSLETRTSSATRTPS